MTDGRTSPVDALVDAFHARHPIRAGSLIVTVYGDAVAPRGGELSTGSLIALLSALRIGDGLVRTALTRLVQDGWLDRTRQGRNSHYRLSEKGRGVFDAATRRIYFAAPGQWDGGWSLAVLDGTGEARTRTRARLEDWGFGALAPNVMLRPNGAGSGAEAPLDAAPGLVRLAATGADPHEARRLAGLVWPLDDLAARYRRFAGRFAPLAEDEATARALDPAEALVVRILLIHEYRRVILRDPLLPRALLPADWPGHAARGLCGRLYDAIRAASERWIDEHGLNSGGPLPSPDAAFARRFRDIAAGSGGA